MALIAASRQLGTSVTEPYFNIIGYFEDIGMSASGDFDLAPLVTADINFVNSGLETLRSYQVVWHLNVQLTSAIPTTISAFPSNPPRRYVGNLNFFGNQAVNRTENINFTNQSFNAGAFVVTDINGRPQDAADRIYTTFNVLTNLPGLGQDGGNNQFQGFHNGEVIYTDRFTWFLFPGITAVGKVLYKAQLTYSQFSTTTARVLPI